MRIASPYVYVYNMQVQYNIHAPIHTYYFYEYFDLELEPDNSVYAAMCYIQITVLFTISSAVKFRVGRGKGEKRGVYSGVIRT